MKIRKTNLLLVWMFTDDVPVSVWWENLRHKATHKAVWEQSPVLQVTFCVLWVTSSAISHVLCHKSRPVLSHVLCHKSLSVLWVTFCTTSHVLCHESRSMPWVTFCAMTHTALQYAPAGMQPHDRSPHMPSTIKYPEPCYHRKKKNSKIILCSCFSWT